MNFSTPSTYGGAMPPLAFNYRHPSRTSPEQPQLLVRNFASGCGGRCGGDCGPCASGTTGTGFGKLLGLGGFRGVRALGDAAAAGSISPGVWIAYSVISSAAATAAAYHGYKRTGSVGWTLGWFLLGAWFPLITIPVALAQGYAKKA